MPDRAHTTSSKPGACTSLRISAETMKMPEPIIEPTTRAVASSREMALTNSALTGGGGGGGGGAAGGEGGGGGGGGCCAVAMRVLGGGRERSPDNLVSPHGARY